MELKALATFGNSCESYLLLHGSSKITGVVILELVIAVGLSDGLLDDEYIISSQADWNFGLNLPNSEKKLRWSPLGERYHG